MKQPAYVIFGRPGDAPVAVCASERDALTVKAALDARRSASQQWPQYYVRAFVSDQTISEERLTVDVDLTDELVVESVPCA